MNSQHKVAILIDGGFFLKRYPKVFKGGKLHSAEQVAKNLYTMAHKHIPENFDLYRIFYYDSEPFNKKHHNPLSKKAIDFGKTEVARFRREFFEELKKKRKVALRLGFVKDSGNWLIKPQKTKELLKREIQLSDLTEDDIYYEMRQKGIDIKIGVDIATLALKKFVSQIILISGDSDFVPASKLARREGIDFILDPMWNKIDDSLFEHIDGLQSKCAKPTTKQI